MLRNIISGSGGAWTLSAKVSVQLVSLADARRSSANSICGRLRRMRMAWPFSSGTRLTSPIDRAALGADRLDVDRLCRIEHQPHGVAAAERRRRRCDREAEGHAQAVAVAADIDAGTVGCGTAGASARRGLAASLPAPWQLPCMACLGASAMTGLAGATAASALRRSAGFDSFGSSRRFLGRFRSVRGFGRGSRLRFRRFGGRHARRGASGFTVGLDVDLGFARDRLGRRRRDLAMRVLRLLGRRLFGAGAGP